MPSELTRQRQRLAERIRASTGIQDARILQAFTAVPRHEFLAAEQRSVAYEDRALPLDDGQTISQPSMIAIMLAELACQPDQRALEVGAGSGYAAALLGQLVREVYAIELRQTLAHLAQTNLERAGASNVHVVQGDGSLGWPPHAPYDRILVSAAPEEVPRALVEQLAPGGILVVPVGNDQTQTLVVGRKSSDGEMAWQRTVPCIFVPLVAAAVSSS